MLDLLKKTIFAGIGAAVVTKERVEKTLNELVEQGRITRDEAERMAEKIAADGKAEFEKTKEEVAQNIQRALGRDKAVNDTEFRKLETRVSILEEKEAAREMKEISQEKSSEKPAGSP